MTVACMVVGMFCFAIERPMRQRFRVHLVGLEIDPTLQSGANGLFGLSVDEKGSHATNPRAFRDRRLQAALL